MKRTDWSILAIIFEAVDIMIGLGYIGLQIYYGHLYHIAVHKVLMNLIVAVLVYAGLTLLAMYPERINSLTPEECSGKVRKYSIRMVRMEKFVFLASLAIPCVCDVMAIHVESLYNAAIIFLMLFIAIFYETKIILWFRKNHK